MSKYIQNIIKYFFNHDVTENTKKKVQDRLAYLTDNANSEEAFREIWDNIENDVLDIDSTNRAYKRFMKALYGHQGLSTRSSWLRIAAISAITIIMAISFFYMSSQPVSNFYEDVTFIHKFTAYGERELITLPDSSKVWLNGGSTLIYPSHFVSTERNVCLSGEAFFDVVKDEKRPFVLNVRQLELKVLGTTFNVFSYPDNPQIAATLESGRIQVNVQGDNNTYILNSNDQLIYDSKTGIVNIGQVKAADYSMWRTGALYFDEIKFCDVDPSKSIRLLDYKDNLSVYEGIENMWQWVQEKNPIGEWYHWNTFELDKGIYSYWKK